MNRWTVALACAAVIAAAIPGLSRGAAAVSPQAPDAARTSYAPLLAANDWINGRATAASLAGRVVVVDVFTVDCYNCQNVVPTLRALYAADRGRGLAVVGIHAPETPAERGRAYVEQNLSRQGIVWPIAVDNGFSLWNAYGVTAWPTELFFDRHGRLRKTIVGDSQDADVRATVAQLLAQ